MRLEKIDPGDGRWIFEVGLKERKIFDDVRCGVVWPSAHCPGVVITVGLIKPEGSPVSVLEVISERSVDDRDRFFALLVATSLKNKTRVGYVPLDDRHSMMSTAFTLYLQRGDFKVKIKWVDISAVGDLETNLPAVRTYYHSKQLIIPPGKESMEELRKVRREEIKPEDRVPPEQRFPYLTALTWAVAGYDAAPWQRKRINGRG